MNSRLMYSRVMLETGRKSVVPGLFAFQWLKTNSPGRPVGICARPGSSCSLAPAHQLEDPVDLGLERLARERRDLALLGHQVPHVEEVEAVVVGEEELGAVVGARARPGAGGPLDQRVGAHRGVDVAEVEPGEAGAGHQQQGLLELGQRAPARRGSRTRACRASPCRAPCGGSCGRRPTGRRGRRGRRQARGQRAAAGAHSPSSLPMISCWISLVPSVIEASLASR